MEEKLETNFRLPIDFCTNKRKLAQNLYDDLELIQSHKDVSGIPLYNYVFNPKTLFGQIAVRQWAKYYTTDINFLTDSQLLYSSCSQITCKPELTEDFWKIWKEIKADQTFLERYQYLEINKLEWLNKSSTFLAIMTFYGLLSPILNLLAPLLILIIPFLIVRALRIPLTITSYTQILKKQLAKHGIGKMFIDFNSVSWFQRVYIIICFGMYIYNIYQNVLSCIHFYNNTVLIQQHFHKLRQLFKHTENQIIQYLEITENLRSYEEFNNYLKDNLLAITQLNKNIGSIPQGKLSITGLRHIGTTMQQFYLLNKDKKVEDTLIFIFGFNGYIETLQGLSHNIAENKLNSAKYSNNKKLYFNMKKSYYPAIKDKVIPNNISLTKNKIITGPNAAGKTTILKSTIFNLLLSQQIGCGFYKKALITPFDFIHCYLNIPDTSARDSLFQAEARRCKTILDTVSNNSSAKHFCIFDELYSGTNPYEAIGSAYSYLRYISNFKNVRFMITTHFVRLCNLFNSTKDTRNYHMETTIVNDEPSYSYRLRKGISKIKGGVCVLKELGYPNQIIIDTEKVIDKL